MFYIFFFTYFRSRSQYRLGKEKCIDFTGYADIRILFYANMIYFTFSLFLHTHVCV